jgi:MFS family permease
MEQQARNEWRTLMRREWIPALAVLLGGILLHSMNVLMLATVLPTIVDELGGASMMSWPTTAFLSSSIVAATCTGLLTSIFGARNTYCVGAAIFCFGAVMCALASSIVWIIAGRFVQGFGGGLLTAVAYVLVRITFPEVVWARVIALLAGMWSVSILVGPLLGGLFVRFSDWRFGFVVVAVIAAAMALAAFFNLPTSTGRQPTAAPVPIGRLMLICAAIAAASIAAIVNGTPAKAMLLVVAIATLVLMLRFDRRAAAPLLPSDAFFPNTPTGIGLWLTVLLCVSYSPLQIYVPVFLQRLRGLDALSAGYIVACASLGWTTAALVVAGASRTWVDRLLLAGPATMAAGLLAVALTTVAGPLPLLVVAIVMIGLGIGMCWAFMAQRIMSGARAGDEAVAAASIATVQQMGFALGAALAGLAANASGFSIGQSVAGTANAAFWVPASFVAFAVAGCAASLRLTNMPEARPPSAS